MKRITSMLALLLLVPTMILLAQAPKPRPEIKALNDWVGDWTFTGTAKDGPKDKEHSLTWRLHGQWILSGFVVQTDQEWVENGITTKFLEIINFDPAKKSYISTGYGDDGSSWISTVTFKGDTWLETGKSTDPDGKTAAFSGSWTVSPDHLSMTATAEQEQNGSKWMWFRVKGTKTPLKSRP
jgi:hypothetical protein